MSKPQSSPNTTSTLPQGGRGSNRNRARHGSERGSGSNLRKPNNINNKKAKAAKQRRSKQFVGDTPKLSEVMFDVGNQTLKKWTTMTQKLYRYLNITHDIAVSKLVENLQDLSAMYYPIPPLPLNANHVSTAAWRQMSDNPTRAQFKFRQNMASAFSVIHRQCTQTFILDMKGEPDYPNVYLHSNTIGLMVIIHRLVHRQEQHQYDIITKINAIHQYFQCCMHENDNPSAFYNRFSSIRTAMHESGIKMVWPSTRETSRQHLYPQIKMTDLNQWQHKEVTDHADESFDAAMIIANSNNKKYKAQLNNDWVMGADHYRRTEATSIRMQHLYI